MASIKVEDVVYHLDREFKRALEDTMKQFAPGTQVDRDAAFRYFLKRVYQHCNIWEDVPSSSVKA